MIRAARYLRVSRSDQREDLQADETEQLIDRRGWKLAETYIDHGISGTKERRPGLDRLLADAKRGRFDVLVVWRSDRLFRSLQHMVNCLAELEARNIHFVSATEIFDTTTPQGKLLFHLVSAFAEFERQVLISRTRAGIEAARRRGAKIGRPEVALDLVKARHLRATGASYREVAAQLGVSVGKLHGALSASDAAVHKT